MDQSVYSTKVDEDTIRSNVLDGSFQYLSFFQLGNDFLLLLLQLLFNECFVGNNNVSELVVDLHYLEFHTLSNVGIVIPDGLHIDLRSWKESFDSEYIYNHTTLGAAFDETLDYFILVKCLVNTFP